MLSPAALATGHLASTGCRLQDSDVSVTEHRIKQAGVTADRSLCGNDKYLDSH